MGRRQRGKTLRAALVAGCAVAGLGVTTSWAQGTGDAGNTLGAPGTAVQPRGPRPQPQAQPQARPERPRFENRTGGTGDAGTGYGAPGTARQPQMPRPQNFDRGQGRGQDRGQDRGPDRRPDFSPGPGPDRDGPRSWNGPGRDNSPGRNFSAGTDRRPDFRPDHGPDRGPDRRPDYRPDNRPGFRPDHRPDYRPPPRFHGGPGYYAGPPARGFYGPPRRSEYFVYVDRRPYLVPPPRIRYYNEYPIVRPYGAWYQGYGRYHSDADAYRWLGLTAITLGVLNMLDEGQQRTLEDAQIQATEVPVGTRLDWDDRGARGSVQVLSDGRDAAGRYCREFEQTVTVNGQTERAVGTACQDGNGVWEVVAPS
jgi:hypothetical protein